MEVTRKLRSGRASAIAAIRPRRASTSPRPTACSQTSGPSGRGCDGFAQLFAPAVGRLPCRAARRRSQDGGARPAGERAGRREIERAAARRWARLSQGRGTPSAGCASRRPGRRSTCDEAVGGAALRRRRCGGRRRGPSPSARKRAMAARSCASQAMTDGASARLVWRVPMSSEGRPRNGASRTPARGIADHAGGVLHQFREMREPHRRAARGSGPSAGGR